MSDPILTATAILTSASEPNHCGRESFEATAAERDALADSDVLKPNADVLAAASTANSAMPAVRSLRGAITGLVSLTYDLTRYDKLQVYIWALQYAQALYVAASRPTGPVPEMAARAAKLREILLSDINALIKRGLIDGKRLDDLRGGVGFRNNAFDLQVMAIILRERWEVIRSRTAIQESELEEAETLGNNLSNAVDGREHTPASVVKATSDRARAFTLFHRSYEEAHRLATFVRWYEGDADTLVPSIYNGRGTGAPKGEPESDKETPAPVTPVTPVASGTPVALVAGHPPVSSWPAVIPGQPGGSPFLR